jgi:hypothetical protein
LQSKIYRAKEALEVDLKNQKLEEEFNNKTAEADTGGADEKTKM